MNIKYTITPTQLDGHIGYELTGPGVDDVHQTLGARIASLGDQIVRAQLVKAGWAPPENGDVVVTWDEAKTRIVAVTRQDAEGRVLSVIAEAPAQQAMPPEPTPASPEDMAVYKAIAEGYQKDKQAQAEAVPSGGLQRVRKALADRKFRDAPEVEDLLRMAANVIAEDGTIIEHLQAKRQAEAVPASVKVAFRPSGNPDEQFDFAALLRPSIHEMAIQAGAARFYPAQQSAKEDAYVVSRQFLERFAELVAARGRMEVDHG